ncbi:MAG: hypothetical protein ACHQRM_11780 [Bacteroidia bacterium]
MSGNMDSSLDDFRPDKSLKGSRRNLLPAWMKAFMWIFLVIGFLLPFELLLYLWHPNQNSHIELYGFVSDSLGIIPALLLICSFLSKE